jgi:iron complex transport system substrate-binding protein
VLQFVPAQNILALSPEAVLEFSYLREEAQKFPAVRPIAEDVLLARPDMVVRSYGGGYGIVGLLEEFAVPVVQLGYANSLADVQRSIIGVSAALGAPERGRKMVADMQTRLEEIAAASSSRQANAMYMTPTGVTAGSGTLMHEMLMAAALVNFEKRRGWQALPLERLVYESPELVARAFYKSVFSHQDFWSAAQHPVTTARLAFARKVPLQGAWTSCGAWFLMDAIEALHKAALDGP